MIAADLILTTEHTLSSWSLHSVPAAAALMTLNYSLVPPSTPIRMQ